MHRLWVIGSPSVFVDCGRFSCYHQWTGMVSQAIASRAETESWATMVRVSLVAPQNLRVFFLRLLDVVRMTALMSVLID